MNHNKYKVLILEDNTAWADMLKTCINKSDDFEVVKVTASETEAFIFTKTYLPDVVIVDLQLHTSESEGDGISFLTRLADPNENLPRQPYKLVTTSVASEKTLTKLSNGLADFTYRKSVIGHTPEHVLSHLRSMTEVFEYDGDYQAFKKKQRESLLDKETLINARINAELDCYYMKNSAVGKVFLAQAIFKAATLPEGEEPLMKSILAEISKNSSRTPHTIDMAIDRVIQNAFSKTDEADLRRLYSANYDMQRGAPTNKDFISYVAKKIKSETIS